MWIIIQKPISYNNMPCQGIIQIANTYFSKFYGKVGVISWFLFHLIWKNYVLYWDFDLKSWIVDFFTRFTHEKTPQNNFSSQNFSVENNYFFSIFLIFQSFTGLFKFEKFFEYAHFSTTLQNGNSDFWFLIRH